MPSRRDIFINDGIYHIFNRTIDNKNIFNDFQLSKQFLDLCTYYRSSKANIRYSQFRRLPELIKAGKLKAITFKKYFKVEILCYCLMSNHFHLLLKQKSENGVLRYVSDIINAVTRHFNILHSRKGPLFLTQFKSRVILSREQLIHVSRYIHLNPYSSEMVKTANEIERYFLSSFQDYVFKRKSSICNMKTVLDEFNNNREKYKEFVLNNAEYQKTLEYAKHAEKWL